MKHRKQSLGELISSVCFAGVAVVWFLYGMEYLRNDSVSKAILLFFCSGFCFLASFRFRIAVIFGRLFNDGSKD